MKTPLRLNRQLAFVLFLSLFIRFYPFCSLFAQTGKAVFRVCGCLHSKLIFMNTKQIRLAYTDPPVYPIKENITIMVNTAWLLAITCLWPCSVFTAKEQRDTKKYIRRFINNVANSYLAYQELCQRILFAHQISMHSGQYSVSEFPTHWFKSSNKNGFAATSAWFQQLQQKRKKHPLLLHTITAFCEAILDMAEEPGSTNFNYWMLWFSRQTANEESMVFQAWTARLYCQH